MIHQSMLETFKHKQKQAQEELQRLKACEPEKLTDEQKRKIPQLRRKIANCECAIKFYLAQ